MKINTGKAPITLMTLLGIWSISLVVNLPGLAVTPMLDNLKHIFPHSTELEVQLLTVLPNLLIIPFVLLAGKLSLSKSKVGIVITALVIFVAAAILYLLSRSMVELILVSCLLGIGAGLLIPLAAGLLADTFVGKYRMQQLGIKSGISNIALVIATYVVGWLSRPGDNWHLPFLVYLIAVIPLVLSPFLKRIPQSDIVPSDVIRAKDKAAANLHFDMHSVNPSLGKIKGTFILSRVWSLFFVYFFIGYATLVFSYYTPFYMEGVGLNSSLVGTVTAIFFLAIFLPGFCLPWVVKTFKGATFFICGCLMCGGLVLMIITHWFWLMCVAAFLAGWGYGTFQPLIYDKSTYTTTDPHRATLALSITLTANYVSVMITPFIAEGFQYIFGQEKNQAFPFWFNAILMGGFILVILWKRKAFVFDVNEAYYQQEQDRDEAAELKAEAALNATVASAMNPAPQTATTMPATTVAPSNASTPKPQSPVTKTDSNTQPKS